ncbi:MAG TPA: biotin/lipoate A/B protein ligase family protein [Bacillota bacterium]|nr:biotin/lipoate A/B protein ligase family protein [Bacillota bacterium]
MAILVLDTLDPYLNLATEEVLLKDASITEDLLILWQSSPAFVLGRNQNPFLEINPSHMTDSIPVIRRISGGGTIYEDLGTLNFSIITNDYKNNINNYNYFLEPVIIALKTLGLDVRLKPKSDLILDDKKISGNAQSFKNNRLLHHGTLLYDTDLNVIYEALVNYKQSFKGTHVTSNKQSVTNLKEHLASQVTMESVLEALVNAFTHSLGISKTPYLLTDEVKNIIHQTATEKYHSWEWNFGKTPLFETTIKFMHKDYLATVDKGLIVDIEPKDKDSESLLDTRYSNT